MRCFVAVPIPQACRESLSRWQQTLRDALPGVRWTRVEGMHLTLCFLGEIADATREALSRVMRERVPRCVPPFLLRARGLGTFPTAARPRVLWSGLAAGSDGALDHLAQLHEVVGAAAREAGCAVEERAFRPHLTIGRFTRGASAGAVRGAIARWGETDHGEIPVEVVRLYRSVLAPGGAIHTVLEEHRL